jgi:hypothetical protein
MYQKIIGDEGNLSSSWPTVKPPALYTRQPLGNEVLVHMYRGVIHCTRY